MIARVKLQSNSDCIQLSHSLSFSRSCPPCLLQSQTVILPPSFYLSTAIFLLHSKLYITVNVRSVRLKSKTRRKCNCVENWNVCLLLLGGIREVKKTRVNRRVLVSRLETIRVSFQWSSLYLRMSIDWRFVYRSLVGGALCLGTR